MIEERFRDARLLVVDDDAATVRLLERLLRQAGFDNLHCTTDPRAAQQACIDSLPDLIILDLHMPEIDGFTLLERITDLLPPDAFVPILIITGDGSAPARERALSNGAKDYLTKPFNGHEVVLRVRNLLETRYAHLRLRRQRSALEAAVRERTQELDEARVEILERLSKAAEYRDDDTRRHTERVGILSARLARSLGLPDETVQLIRRAAPLHDLGKIGIPDRILLKPGPLTAEETEIMKTHTTIGAQILAAGRAPTLTMAAEIALAHHEHWDGNGYPLGLSGIMIPVSARIVAVADFVDALSHDRPYRRAWPMCDIVAELRIQCGRRFDPDIASAMLDLVEHERPLAAVG